MRIQAWDKPYKCSYCGKAFSLNIGIIRQIKTHTRENPIQYSHCDKYFFKEKCPMQHNINIVMVIWQSQPGTDIMDTSAGIYIFLRNLVFVR